MEWVTQFHLKRNQKGVRKKMAKVRLNQDCKRGSKGDIIDLEGTELDVLTSEGIAEVVEEEEDIAEAPEIENIGEENVWSEIENELDNPEEREFPQKWIPEEDGNPEKLIGEVERTTETQYGPAAIIETTGGETWTIFSGRRALEDFLENVERGDKVGVKYLGQEKSESGQAYHNYTTTIK